MSQDPHPPKNPIEPKEPNSPPDTEPALWRTVRALARRRSLWTNAALILAALIAAILYWRGTEVLTGDVAKVKFFLIGTGSTGGTYFPVGEALAAVISHPPGSDPCVEGSRCGVRNLLAVVKSTAGSVANARNVADGRLDSALVQANVLARAFEGEGEFKNEQARSNLRVIANLYPEAVHLVVARGLGIEKVADLKGRRVSIGPKGSGTRADARQILKAYGLTPRTVDLVEEGASRSAQMILSGELDAFFLVTGAPARSIADLTARDAVDLLSIEGAPADNLRLDYPFLTSREITAGTYRDIPAVRTLSVGALWVVSAQADDQLIYDITRALFDPANSKILRSAHAKGHFISLETAVTGVPILLHPGAERFYIEAGILVP